MFFLKLEFSFYIRYNVRALGDTQCEVLKYLSIHITPRGWRVANILNKRHCYVLQFFRSPTVNSSLTVFLIKKEKR